MSLANNTASKKAAAPSGSTDSPYLGSKISLVSKAKIRYEGILYTIDANESTVALSKVRSFGTEDRPTDRPVPPRDEIFEYIIFRGADIEDLQVREPPQSTLTQDPAIVESSMYPTSNTRSNNLATTNNLANNQVRSLANQGTMPSPPTQPGLNNKGNKSASNADPLRQLNFNQQSQSSRSFNQQSASGQADGQDYSYGNQRRSGRQQQDYYNDFSNNGNSNNRRGNQKYGYNEWSRTNNSAWDNGGYRQQQQQQQQSQRYSRPQQQQQQQSYDGNRFYPSRRPNNGQQSNGYYGNRERRNSTGGITGTQPNQTRNNNRQQRERADSIRGNSNGRSALKFIGDFDFEKSNAEFNKNAIEDEIKKSLSIKPTTAEKDNEPTTTTTTTDQEKPIDQEPPVQPVSQPATTATVGKLEEQEQDPNNPDGFYDKQKSFFDRISCETTEKEKTNPGRRNRNEERRINAETFGLKYRPLQQGGNQRNGQGGYYNNNNRRNNSGQQSFYGNGPRYQRGGGGGGGGGNYQDGQPQRGRNNTYYSNSNNRTRAY